MKNENLFAAIGGAEEELLARSEKRVRVNWVKRVSIAACIIMIACAGSYLIIKNMNNTSTAGGPLHIIVNDVAYYNSWITVKECPAGFEYGGIVDAATGDGSNNLLNSKYYISAEIPEWIYVYSSILSGNEKNMTYIRFATANVLYKRYIMFNGQLYQSMWSYVAAEDNSDSLWSAFNELESRYGGIEIEKIPEDCVLAGTAHLEELNRIPKTELGVNFAVYDKSAVYADPDDSQVLYVSASWHTATEEEKVETLHNGYDVFVLYTQKNSNPIA